MDRGHRSSPSPLFVRQNSDTPDRHPTPPIARLALPPLRSHFPRDGYDFRRPASSTRSNTSANNLVIDLTSDDESAPSNIPTPQPEPAAGPSALPRFGREIIDLSADTSPPQSAQSGHARRPSSPEVQFVSSRPLSRTEQRPSQPPPFLHPEFRRPPTGGPLTLDPDDDVMIAGERAGVNLLRPLGVQRRPELGRLAQMVLEGGRRRLRDYAMLRGGPIPSFWGADDEEDLPQPNRNNRNPLLNMPLPFMNYETVAFGLATNDEPPQLPVPKYDPPPPAAKGFTRDPTEDDTIICPNCEDELAVGETEEKRQVWVVKACGHVSVIPDTIPPIQQQSTTNTPLLGLLRHMHEQPQEKIHKRHKRQRTSGRPGATETLFRVPRRQVQSPRLAQERRDADFPLESSVFVPFENPIMFFFSLSHPLFFFLFFSVDTPFPFFSFFFFFFSSSLAFLSVQSKASRDSAVQKKKNPNGLRIGGVLGRVVVFFFFFLKHA